jgi:hypothetical protein
MKNGEAAAKGVGSLFYLHFTDVPGSILSSGYNALSKGFTIMAEE